MNVLLRPSPKTSPTLSAFKTLKVKAPNELSRLGAHPRLSSLSGVHLLSHRWQTQDPQAEFGPPPGFIRPSILFLPGGSAGLLAPS